MPGIETYRRRKEAREKVGIDVYDYDDVPQRLRVQIIHIIHDVVGDPAKDHGYYRDAITSIFTTIVEIIKQETGVFQLNIGRNYNPSSYTEREIITSHMMICDTDDFLSIVELFCRAMNNICSKRGYRDQDNPEQTVKDALENINFRFKQNNFGYQFEDWEIVKLDSELLHSEAVRPALAVLRLPGFEAAQGEFITAHEHYRNQRNTEAVVECNKAFESVMKAICAKHGWAHDPSKPAGHLIKVCLDHGLIPAFNEQSLTGLRMLLESAIPTPRNKSGAHGGGTKPIVVSDSLASYVLHLTASTLLFLGRADEAV